MSRAVVVAIAHPDDETFVSGTICLLGELGYDVNIICATEGEGAIDGTLEDRRRIRPLELKRSISHLGATLLECCALPDVGNPFSEPCPWDLAAFTAKIKSHVVALQPAVVITHGPLGGYGHLAHKAVWMGVSAAVREQDTQIPLFSFCGHVPGAFFSWRFDERSDVLVNVDYFKEKRVASLAEHKTQATYFLQPLFPKNARKLASAAFGYCFAFTEAGRKRIPIATADRYMARFGTEGLVLQGGENFFAGLSDPRITIVGAGLK